MLLRSRAWGWALVHGLRGRPRTQLAALRAEDFDRVGSVMRISGPRWPPNIGSGWFRGEPGDAEDMDEQGGFVAPRSSGEDMHVWREREPFRGVGDAGQLPFSWLEDRVRLAADRADR